MTREQLKKQSPLTFEFTESIGETEKFLTWEKAHQDLLCAIVEFADEAGKNTTPIETYRKRAEEFFSSIENEEERRKVIEFSESILHYIESLRKARKS